MSEAEYINLVRNAAAKWQQLVHILQYHHPKADYAAIEDAVESALIILSNREKILKIEHPDKPFRWLLKTSERCYQRQNRIGRTIPIDELDADPLETDYEIESFESRDTTETILSMILLRYAEIIMAVEREGFSFEEIAEKENIPVGRIYDRYERAKKKAKETAEYLESPRNNRASRAKK